jgi:hypothetical protein
LSSKKRPAQVYASQSCQWLDFAFAQLFAPERQSKFVHTAQSSESLRDKIEALSIPIGHADRTGAVVRETIEWISGDRSQIGGAPGHAHRDHRDRIIAAALATIRVAMASRVTDRRILSDCPVRPRLGPGWRRRRLIQRRRRRARRCRGCRRTRRMGGHGHAWRRGGLGSRVRTRSGKSG